MGLPCILLVEDEPLLRDAVAEALEEEGFAVVRAETGAEALAKMLQEPRVEVLVTDVRLPGYLDGWDVGERFRAAHPDAPVIYATGAEIDGRVVPGGVVMRKPYRPSQIAGAIRRLITPQ